MAIIQDFADINCKLWQNMGKTHFAETTFSGIYAETNGDPCTPSCAWFQGGKCKEYLALMLNCSELTNTELAKKLHCSKRQVSKMRKNSSSSYQPAQSKKAQKIVLSLRE